MIENKVINILNDNEKSYVDHGLYLKADQDFNIDWSNLENYTITLIGADRTIPEYTIPEYYSHYNGKKDYIGLWNDWRCPSVYISHIKPDKFKTILEKSKTIKIDLLGKRILSGKRSDLWYTYVPAEDEPLLENIATRLSLIALKPNFIIWKTPINPKLFSNVEYDEFINIPIDHYIEF